MVAFERRLRWTECTPKIPEAYLKLAAKFAPKTEPVQHKLPAVNIESIVAVIEQHARDKKQRQIVGDSPPADDAPYAES